MSIRISAASGTGSSTSAVRSVSKSRVHNASWISGRRSLPSMSPGARARASGSLGGSGPDLEGTGPVGRRGRARGGILRAGGRRGREDRRGGVHAVGLPLREADDLAGGERLLDEAVEVDLRLDGA